MVRALNSWGKTKYVMPRPIQNRKQASVIRATNSSIHHVPASVLNSFRKGFKTYLRDIRAEHPLLPIELTIPGYALDMIEMLQ